MPVAKANSSILSNNQDPEIRVLRTWNMYHLENLKVLEVYKNTVYNHYAERMEHCAHVLWFHEKSNSQTGEINVKFKNSNFCRVRHCPICQWRRSLMWYMYIIRIIPEIMSQYKAKWLLLTLTVRNCKINELRNTISQMNRGWGRMLKRRELQPVLGWIRVIEVTRSAADNSAHPHFHALLMVRPSMLTTRYVPHRRWVDTWRSCMRLDYDPVVDIRRIESGQEDQVPKYILKYAFKEQKTVLDDHMWFLEMTKQLYHMRMIATGGVIKNALKIAKIMDYIDCEDTEEKEEKKIAFAWQQKHYLRAPEFDH